MSSTKKYENLINSGCFSERELKAFRKYINRKGSELNPEIVSLVRMFENRAERFGIAITKNQEERARKWLIKVTYKMNGKIRRNAILQAFERVVLENLLSISCIGLYNNSTNSEKKLTPIYKCSSKDGFFEYAYLRTGKIKLFNTGKFKIKSNEKSIKTVSSEIKNSSNEIQDLLGQLRFLKSRIDALFLDNPSEEVITSSNNRRRENDIEQ